MYTTDCPHVIKFAFARIKAISLLLIASHVNFGKEFYKLYELSDVSQAEKEGYD